MIKDHEDSNESYVLLFVNKEHLIIVPDDGTVFF